MKQKINCRLTLARLLVLLIVKQAQPDEFEECAGIVPGVYVASYSSCAKYIYCAGPGSFEAECFAEHFYDVEQDRCMERALVRRCQSEYEQGSLDTSVPNKLDSVGAVKNLSQNHKQQWTLTVHQYGSSGNCAVYMLCYQQANIIVACMPAELVTCQQASRPVQLVCQEGIYDLIPHPHNCAYFYYCANGIKILHRCPYDYSWHYKRRTCVQRSDQKLCYNQRTWIKTAQPREQLLIADENNDINVI